MIEASSSNPWQGKRVLITGVCGTVGRELLRQVCQQNPAQVIGLDNNESALFFVREELRNQPEVQLYLGDMRDRDRLIAAMDGIDVVLHSAALKHVILCEQSPRDAIQSNILGVQNIIDAARTQRVERVLFTSSDKAVNPTNVMGTSKLMGERLMTAANAMRRGSGPIFASTRFGNVLGSRGSVIPLFRRQIAQGYQRTRHERLVAVRLVMDSTFLAHGGEVFVTKMPVARIQDLAAVMIEELAPLHGYDPADIAIEIIGSKPGEKLYEELMNDEETRRTVELPDYFVVLPAFKSVYEDIDYCYPEMGQVGVDRPYNSSVEPALGREALRQYLKKNGLLHETAADKADKMKEEN